MFNCPSSKCRWKGACIDQYFPHVQRMHDPLNGYMCLHNCGRLLTSITSLRKHVLLCRDQNKIEAENQSSSRENVQSEIEIGNQSSSRENDQNEIEVRNQLQDSIDTGKLVTVDANRLSLSMTLKWLSENGMARKVAFDINRDIKRNVIEPLSSVINDLQMAGAMTNEGKQLLDSMLGSYNCTSEYKFIQQLKTDGFYEDPTFFTINEELLLSSACLERLIY
ncbi:uncharacterized protein LOC135702682 [Ochlerotatus camptorhynchus]|uniref:uncharacterized protein LOC135702682 n=1 Tax=Ochlerotatus camptorhynchus TaxID=644619 RepID=UPI0031E24BE6